MPMQEFWYDDPDLLWAYRNVYVEKEKQEIEIKKEMANFKTWLQGYYNYVAIGKILSNKRYLSKPIDLNTRPKTEKEKKLEIAQKIKENMRKGKTILEQKRSENKG